MRNVEHLKKGKQYFKSFSYAFIVLALLGANGMGICWLLIPDKPFGNLFYITILPFFIGVAGFNTCFFFYIFIKRILINLEMEE